MDCSGFDKEIFLPTLSSITADMPQVSKHNTGKPLLIASSTTVEVSSLTDVKKNRWADSMAFSTSSWEVLP